MDLYTLTSRFFPRDEITEFTSVIWTERYSSAGDVQLVVPATPVMAAILAPGTFLGLRGTKEIMLLDKHSVENDLLTVSGQSLPKFLDERPALFPDDSYDGSSGSPYGDYTATTTAGQLISSAVHRMVIVPTSTFNLDWALEKIVGLDLGHVDDNGTPKPLSFPKGTLYDGIQSLATEEGLGFKLYLESAKYSTRTYVLKFATYRGRNRTSDQDVHGVVRLSPRLDSLTDVKEITSLSEYKNVIYVSYKNSITKHYVNPNLPIPTGFDRRSLFVEAPDLYFDSDQKIIDFRAQVARNELANHIYVKMVDGQVSPQIDYKFGDDYYLGDVLELQGFSGLFSKARVTEYIRAQDQFGTKEYPTLAVLDPLKTGYLPDLEPDPPNPDDPDDPSNFDEDSDFDLDIEPSDDEHWNPDNENSDYDPEHDPKRYDYDPNPDPEEDFGSEGDGGPGGGGDGSGMPTPGRTYILTGYYPDQNKGEAIAFLEYGGTGDPVLKQGWVYKSEDPNGEATWLELVPHGWTVDKKGVVVRSTEYKDATDASPWNRGNAFWIKDVSRPNAIRITETIPENYRHSGPEFGESHGYIRPSVNALWCESAEKANLYLESQYTYPLEYLFANGTYTTDPDRSIDDGVMVANGSPVELFVAGSNGGVIAKTELQRLLGRTDFPQPHLRWSRFNDPRPSPDGNKLVFWRRELYAPATWSISSSAIVFGGYFTLTVGPVGNEIMSYETQPISYNATADDVWEALLACGPLLQDPRLRGYPYQPFGMGSTPLEQGGQVQLFFDSSAANGVWLTSDNTNIIPGPFGSVYQVYTNIVQENGPVHWYMCNYDGSNLEEIDFGGIDLKDFQMQGWSPDSTKILGTMTDSDRYISYDVSTNEATASLDDYRADNPTDYYVRGPLMSPNSSRLAWVTPNKKLWVSNADGSNPTEIYEQTVDYNSTDQDVLVLGGELVWSFDSTKLAIVDSRDPSPVWVINVDTPQHAIAKIWPGTGWDNEDDQKWIYDMQQFEGR